MQTRINIKQTRADAAAEVRDAGIGGRDRFDLRFDERVGRVERIFESLGVLHPQRAVDVLRFFVSAEFQEEVGIFVVIRTDGVGGNGHIKIITYLFRYNTCVFFI